jgi:hypothetical protein
MEWKVFYDTPSFSIYDGFLAVCELLLSIGDFLMSSWPKNPGTR